MKQKSRRCCIRSEYRDGAVLIDRGGRLLASNVILRPTKAGEQAARDDGRHPPYPAARHTYDCPDVLAFVVSIDGPVTVFSDGLRIARLRRPRLWSGRRRPSGSRSYARCVAERGRTRRSKSNLSGLYLTSDLHLTS